MESKLLQDDGAVTLAFGFDRTLDRKQVEEMADVVERAMETHRELRLLLDLRATEEFEMGAFVSPKGMISSLKSIGPVTRYAVVGAPKIVEIAVETFGTLLPLKSRAFEPHEFDLAMDWVQSPAEEGSHDHGSSAAGH